MEAVLSPNVKARQKATKEDIHVKKERSIG